MPFVVEFHSHLSCFSFPLSLSFHNFCFFSPTFCLAVIKLNRHKYQTAAMRHGCSLLSRVFANTQRLAESLVTKQAACVNYTRSYLQRKRSRDTYSRLLWETQTRADTNTDDMFIETNLYNRHAGKFMPTERGLCNREMHINNVNISQTANVSEKFWWGRSNRTSLKSLNWICHNLCKPKKDWWLSKIHHSTLRYTSFQRLKKTQTSHSYQNFHIHKFWLPHCKNLKL